MCQECRDREAAAANQRLAERQHEDLLASLDGLPRDVRDASMFLRTMIDNMDSYVGLRVLGRAVAYLENPVKGSYYNAGMSTNEFRGDDPVQMLTNRRTSSNDGFADWILSSALNYLEHGDRIAQDVRSVNEYDERCGTEAFFAREEDALVCISGEHMRSPDGDEVCDCKEASCGCIISSNAVDVSICDRCEDCTRCCTSCFTCGDCGEREDRDNKCENCGECRECCNNEGSCTYCNGCDRRRNYDSFCGNCDFCENCCSCWYCDSCGESHSESTEQCDECNRCLDSCNCVTCDHCGEHPDDWCYNCSRCGDCCVADDDCSTQDVTQARRNRGNAGSRPEFAERELQFHNSERTQFKTNTLKRHISAEIEVDRANGNAATLLQQAIVKWGDSVVEDGSLSGSVAHEVNTQPTNGDRFLEHIKEITDGYKQVGAYCSSECGLHVHINCKDLPFYGMRKVLKLYAKVERALFELCADRRLNGSYSLVCGYNYLNMSADPRVFKRQLLSTLYFANGKRQLIDSRPDRDTGKHIARAKTTKGDELREYQLRYRALNIHSYFHRGSIEFRHHEGTVDYTEITNWAMTCGHVIQAAQSLPEMKINVLPDNPFEAMLAILPNPLQEWCKTKWECSESNGVVVWGRRRRDSYWQEFNAMTGTLPTKTAAEVRADKERQWKEEGRCISCGCYLSDGNRHDCGCQAITPRCAQLYPEPVGQPVDDLGDLVNQLSSY